MRTKKRAGERITVPEVRGVQRRAGPFLCCDRG